MFWRGVLGYLPVNLVQAVAGFGSILVFTRLLSPAAYGDYALAFSVATLGHTLSMTWIEAAMARFYAAEPEGPDREALFATVYGLFAVLGFVTPIAAALVLAFAPVSFALKLATAAGLVSAVARGLLKLSQERRRAAGDVRGFANFDMAVTGGGFLLGGLLAGFTGLGAASPFVGMGVASTACLVFALPSELKVARRGRFDWARARAFLVYGVPLSLSLMLSLALATTDRFVLAAYAGEAAVGAYHAGYTLSNRTLDVIFLWIGMAGGPAAVAALELGGAAALRKTALNQAAMLLVVALPAAVGLAMVSQPLAQIMVGPDLTAQAARVTPWIAAGGLFSGLSTYYLHTAFTLARRTGLQMVAVGIPAAANLVLCLALIPRFGLNGAMWSTAGSYGLGMVASYALGQRCLKLPIPWRALAEVGAATALMALAITVLPALGGFRELFLKTGVGALAYGAALLALNPGGVRSIGVQLVRTRFRSAGPGDGPGPLLSDVRLEDAA
ncbi:MAG TPA: lipopolysaccharide biosynthesis protein [Caulobacteraceae bacterium]|jgi:O-antigen/teichoic acid export membrane protein|nr:lipopolysaccharide biosynthesis protein [Caulobacteraceae bacterium]